MEDGTFAGEGLTILQTLTYFVIAPTLLYLLLYLFLLISPLRKLERKVRKHR